MGAAVLTVTSTPWCSKPLTPVPIACFLAVPSQQQKQQTSAAAVLASTQQQQTSAAAVLASTQQQQQQQHAGSLAAMPLLHQQQRRQQELQQVAAAQLGSSSSPGLLDTLEQEDQLAALERQHSPASTPASRQTDASSPAASLHCTSALSHGKPEAAELALQFPGDVAAMRAVLAEMGLSQLPDRFSDAELMRYAVTKGYLAATTPEQRQRALRQVRLAGLRWVLQRGCPSKRPVLCFRVGPAL